MIDCMQLWRFLDEPWETVQPPIENLLEKELNQVAGARLEGGEIYPCPAFVNM